MVNQIYIRTDIVNTHDKHCVYEYSVKREITLITFFKKLEAYETILHLKWMKVVLMIGE